MSPKQRSDLQRMKDEAVDEATRLAYYQHIESNWQQIKNDDLALDIVFDGFANDRQLFLEAYNFFETIFHEMEIWDCSRMSHAAKVGWGMFVVLFEDNFINERVGL